MPLRRLMVLFERHHVHWAHRFKLLLQSAARFFFIGKGTRLDPRNLRVLTQRRSLDAKIVHTRLFNMLQVGCSFAAFALRSLFVSRRASVLSRADLSASSISASEIRSNVASSLQRAASSSACSRVCEQLARHRELLVFTQPLFALRVRRAQLLLQLLNPLRKIAIHPVDAPKAISAPRRRSSRPASSADTADASLCAASRAERSSSTDPCSSPSAASAASCPVSSVCVSSRLRAMNSSLARRASLLRSFSIAHCCARPSSRRTSASI